MEMAKSMGRVAQKKEMVGQPSPPMSKLEQMHEVHKFSDQRPAQPSPPSYSIGQRLRRARDDDKRGPGAYMSIWEQTQGPAYSFRKKERESKDDGPGPGEYHSGVGYRAIKTSSPAYSMGVRCGPTVFGAPSPGGGGGGAAYDVDKNRRNGNAYSMGYKAGSGFSRGPGPGTYNHELKSGSPSFSIGSRIRSSNERSESPGPGAYEVHRKLSGPSFSMASKVKSQVTQRDLNPGPGAYGEDLSAPRTRGLSFTMREKFRNS